MAIRFDVGIPRGLRRSGSASNDRRLGRLHEQWAVFPDVLLIDGGKGQLGAALAALSDLELSLPIGE